jgi:crotonobetainyl-CoA:carnitine CoA-transferase CaiB-like acyl-CoA transferase
MGADVARVELPNAWPDPGPFLEEGTNRQSLYRYHFHTNKRSVTLGVGSPGGREILRRMLSVSDVSRATRGCKPGICNGRSFSAAAPSLVHTQ